jgi:hypothetical protein
VVTSAQARALALALPEAVEQDHHGRPSFRVAGKIFATLWDAEHMNVMVDEAGILTAAQTMPEICREIWWGKRLAAVRVGLSGADPKLLAVLLEDAWECKAPARLRGVDGYSGLIYPEDVCPAQRTKLRRQPSPPPGA